MTKVHFSDDFKRDAVRQITERGYPVREVSEGNPPVDFERQQMTCLGTFIRS